MVKTTGPVDCNVALLAVESCGTFHGSTSADTTEFEQTIEDRTIITDVILGLLTHVAVHVVGRDPPKKLNILVGVELCHLVDNRRLRTLDRIVALIYQSGTVGRVLR